MITAEDVRRLALSLPESVECEAWGHPTFRVRNKMFATLSMVDAVASVKASIEDQQELIMTEPDTFGVAAYTGRYGWVTVQLLTVDPEMMRAIVVEAWRRTAPKAIVSAFDAANGAMAYSRS